ILNEWLTRLGRGARVVICGAISQYNNTEAVAGPSNYMALLVARASMTGFLVFDYADRYDEAAGWPKGVSPASSTPCGATSSHFPARCWGCSAVTTPASSCSSSSTEATSAQVGD